MESHLSHFIALHVLYLCLRTNHAYNKAAVLNARFQQYLQILLSRRCRRLEPSYCTDFLRYELLATGADKIRCVFTLRCSKYFQILEQAVREDPAFVSVSAADETVTEYDNEDGAKDATGPEMIVLVDYLVMP